MKYDPKKIPVISFVNVEFRYATFTKIHCFKLQPCVKSYTFVTHYEIFQLELLK